MMDVSALCLSPFLLIKQSLFEAKNTHTRNEPPVSAASFCMECGKDKGGV